MIYAIVGRPGSGKSYESVVYHILPAIKAGRRVVTNIPLKLDKIVDVFGKSALDLITVIDGKLNQYGSLDRPFGKANDYIEHCSPDDDNAPLFVVDEAHMVLPNRNIDSAILEYYSLHRHYGVDIILVTQNLRKIHRDIKAMVELTYYCAKNTAFGSDKTYVKKVKIADSTEVVNSEVRKLKPSYYGFYSSHTQSNSAISEAAASDIKPIWRTWPFYGAVICLLVGIAWTASSVYDFASGIDKEPSPHSASQHHPASTGSGSVSGSHVPAGRKPAFRQKSMPLDGFDLFVTGYAKQTLKTRKLEDMDFTKRTLYEFDIVYLDVFYDDKRVFSLKRHDLLELGYSFDRLSDCVYRLSAGATSKIVTCKEPSKPETFDRPADVIKSVSF